MRIILFVDGTPIANCTGWAELWNRLTLLLNRYPDREMRERFQAGEDVSLSGGRRYCALIEEPVTMDWSSLELVGSDY